MSTMKLDLETLKQIKFIFDIHSDHSSHCNGYRSLCREIDKLEKEGAFSLGDKIEVFDYHGEDEKWWKPAVYYAKSIHENRVLEDSYVVGYNDGSLDEVVEIRKKII